MLRHDADFDPIAGLTPAAMPRFVGAALDYGAGTVLDWHDHPTGQLVFAASGALRLATADTAMLLPPSLAAWVPAGAVHRIAMAQPVAMRTLYVRPDAPPLPGERCRILGVTALLRELVLAAMPGAQPTPGSARERALFDLLAAEIAAAPEWPLALPLPRDRRIRRLAEAALEATGETGSVAAWIGGAAASPRTVERLFLRETGLTPGQWLRQARLMAAVARLAEGVSVTAVALELGYATPSAFAYMVRRSLGVSPGRFRQQAVTRRS